MCKMAFVTRIQVIFSLTLLHFLILTPVHGSIDNTMSSDEKFDSVVAKNVSDVGAEDRKFHGYHKKSHKKRGTFGYPPHISSPSFQFINHWKSFSSPHKKEVLPTFIEKYVPVPVHVKVPVEKPVPVPKYVPVTIEKAVPYPVKVNVPQPYPVYKKIAIPVKVPVDRPVPVQVLKPYPVLVEKQVPYPVDKPVPIPVRVPVDRPVPVYVAIEKTTTTEKPNFMNIKWVPEKSLTMLGIPSAHSGKSLTWLDQNHANVASATADLPQFSWKLPSPQSEEQIDNDKLVASLLEISDPSPAPENAEFSWPEGAEFNVKK